MEHRTVESGLLETDLVSLHHRAIGRRFMPTPTCRANPLLTLRLKVAFSGVK
jgi:hypothetical protein